MEIRRKRNSLKQKPNCFFTQLGSVSSKEIDIYSFHYYLLPFRELNTLFLVLMTILLCDNSSNYL